MRVLPPVPLLHTPYSLHAWCVGHVEGQCPLGTWLRLIQLSGGWGTQLALSKGTCTPHHTTPPQPQQCVSATEPCASIITGVRSALLQQQCTGGIHTALRREVQCSQMATQDGTALMLETSSNSNRADSRPPPPPHTHTDHHSWVIPPVGAPPPPSISYSWIITDDLHLYTHKRSSSLLTLEDVPYACEG